MAESDDKLVDLTFDIFDFMMNHIDRHKMSGGRHLVRWRVDVEEKDPMQMASQEYWTESEADAIAFVRMRAVEYALKKNGIEL